MEGTGVNPDLESTDIVFECPNCYKSLAIDPKAGGLFITCPDCGERMQIPYPEGESDTEETALLESEDWEDMGLTREKVAALLQDLNDTKSRRANLEKLRMDSFSRFEKISEELAVIQAAIDRIITLIQEAPVELRR